MGDDACNAVKSDLKAGTYTNYTTDFPIYIKGGDKFQGGNVFIHLKDGSRTPVQTVSGSILYTQRSCSLQIMANTTTNRDALYDDIIDILTSTSRGYAIKKGRDDPYSTEHYSLTLDLTFLL